MEVLGSLPDDALVQVEICRRVIIRDKWLLFIVCADCWIEGCMNFVQTVGLSAV